MTTSEEPLHVGDIGTIFEVTFHDRSGAILPINLATTKQILLKPDSGVGLVRTGVFKTDGTDGVLTYTTIAGDLKTADRWQVQGYVVLPVGEWHSTKHAFKVDSNLA